MAKLRCRKWGRQPLEVGNHLPAERKAEWKGGEKLSVGEFHSLARFFRFPNEQDAVLYIKGKKVRIVLGHEGLF